MSAFRLSQTASRQICYARVICISLMIFVHADPTDAKIVELDVPYAIRAFYWVLVAELGRASVPLLSVISGALLVMSMQRGSTIRSVAWNKFQRLLLPLLFWNFLLIDTLVIRHHILAASPPDLAYIFDSWPNKLFALTDTPANFPLAFLRDIFVCSILAAIAMTLENRKNFAGQLFMLGCIGVVMVQPESLPLVQRELIIIFYTIGFMMACNLKEPPHLPWAVVIGLMLLQIGIDIGQLAPEIPTEVIKRLAVCMLFWKTSEFLFLREKKHPWIAGIARQEQYIYVVFCSHLIVTRAYGVFWERMGIYPEAPYFPLVYLMNLPLAFAFAWLVWKLSEELLPALQPFVSGKPFAKVRFPGATADFNPEETPVGTPSRQSTERQ